MGQRNLFNKITKLAIYKLVLPRSTINHIIVDEKTKLIQNYEVRP